MSHFLTEKLLEASVYLRSQNPRPMSNGVHVDYLLEVAATCLDPTITTADKRTPVVLQLLENDQWEDVESLDQIIVTQGCQFRVTSTPFEFSGVESSGVYRVVIRIPFFDEIPMVINTNGTTAISMKAGDTLRVA